MDDVTFVTAVEDKLRAIVTVSIAEALTAIDSELEPYAALCTSAVTAGGKRLRPRFAYWGWRAGNADAGTWSHIVTIGAALELLHAAILVHDDIIDSALLRRGLPSVRAALADTHRRCQWAGEAIDFGDHAALLLGDLLWACAQDAMADATAELPAAGRAEVTQQFRAMRLEVMAGQLLELDAQAAQLLTDEAADKILTYKTSRYTVERPVALGLTVADASPGTTAALGRYSAATGRAFQLRDDLNDLYGPTDTSGKIVGGDIRDGKPTELLGTALRLANEAQRQRLADVVGDPHAGQSAIDDVKKIVLDTGAVAAIEHRVGELAATASQALREPGADLSATVHDAFHGLLDECTDLSFLRSPDQ
jgi:geranylgeranyl diphosphate synthase type I